MLTDFIADQVVKPSFEEQIGELYLIANNLYECLHNLLAAYCAQVQNDALTLLLANIRHEQTVFQINYRARANGYTPQLYRELMEHRRLLRPANEKKQAVYNMRLLANYHYGVLRTSTAPESERASAIAFFRQQFLETTGISHTLVTSHDFRVVFSSDTPIEFFGKITQYDPDMDKVSAISIISKIVGQQAGAF